MAFIISLGTINKKYFLIVVYIICYAIYNIYLSNNESNEAFFFLEGFGYSIGGISSFFITNKIKYHRITVKNKDKSKKKYIKEYLILIIIDLFYLLRNIAYIYFLNIDNGLYLNEAIEIILLTLITSLLLKYKYYIHHFISIAILTILFTLMDLILDNFKKINFLFLVESIIYISLDALMFSYIKYLIEFKYFYFLDIIFVMGVLEFIFYFVGLIIVIIINNINGSYTIIFNFFYFYNDYGAWKIIYTFLSEFIIIAPLIGINEIIIVKELSPNHIIIGYQLSKIPLTIIENNGNNRWAILVISIFQIIFLMFFLEIFEYNFCSLNKNTKKSIMEREKSQTFDDKDNEIVINGYDFAEGMKNQKEEVEMAKINEVNENDD